jgi:DHA2 family multidrug resistance protein
MTTSFGVGQMLIGVACPYLGAIFGVRRVLLLGMILLFVASLLGPLSPNLNAFLAAQFMAGVGSGTFIPLSIGFIVRNLPTKLTVYGIAIYAMNLELSQRRRRVERTSREPVGLGGCKTGRHPGVY